MAAIAGIVSAGLGIASLFKKDKPPAPVAPPPAPTVANAEADARAQQVKRRKISMLNGGNTNLTQSTNSTVAGVGTKSLLGG